MNSFVLIILLQLSVCNQFGPVAFTDIKTVDQGMIELRETFPDWRENYTPGEFDCSEMSAFVYEYLKCCGLEPEIKMGHDIDKGYSHAWVECQGKIVEATQLKISTDTAFYAEINQYTLISGLKGNEFDWWNSNYIKRQCYGCLNYREVNPCPFQHYQTLHGNIQINQTKY